jgi:pimeloyl-ACP methyl ester carboxylesterase
VIVWGDSDRVVPPVYGPAFQAAIAGPRLVKVPEAGHMVVVEKPGAVLEAVAGLA